jgi:hypothetical protein
MKVYDCGYTADIPFSTLCSGCKHLQVWEGKSQNYQCIRGVMASGCAARSDNSGYSSSGRVYTQNSCGYFEPGSPAYEGASRASSSGGGKAKGSWLARMGKNVLEGLFQQ